MNVPEVPAVTGRSLQFSNSTEIRSGAYRGIAFRMSTGTYLGICCCAILPKAENKFRTGTRFRVNAVVTSIYQLGSKRLSTQRGNARDTNRGRAGTMYRS